MMPKKYNKKCLVPNCPHNNHRNPEKRFIGIPSTNTQEKKELRQAWFKALGLPVDYLRDEVKGHNVCEDHFNLQEDMENYYEVQLSNYRYYRCKPGVIPSRNLNLPKHPCARKPKSMYNYENKLKEVEAHQHPGQSPLPVTLPRVQIEYEKWEENEIPSVISENTKEILQANKNSSSKINITNSIVKKEESVFTTSETQANKGTITNTLKRKDMSTNTTHLSDNEIDDMLSKRIKVKTYSRFYDNSDSSDDGYNKRKFLTKDEDWELCQSDENSELSKSESESDISITDSDASNCGNQTLPISFEKSNFAKQCIEITRINHKKSWEKYFGLPSDCYWVIDSLSKELPIGKRYSKHMKKRDYVEFILRKLHLKEDIVIIADHYGIIPSKARRIYYQFIKLVSDALHSIGINIE